jgi:Uma2 family endonuclease
LGRVKMTPSQTKLGPDLPGREPDLMFIAEARLDIIKPSHVDGPPDLIIEIVSPESQGRDYGIKLNEYEQAGVREYWIIDPLRDDVLFYQLDDEGVFRRFAPDEKGTYHSVILPGLKLEVALLWRDPLPDIFEAIALVRAM